MDGKHTLAFTAQLLDGFVTPPPQPTVAPGQQRKLFIPAVEN